MDRWIPRAAVRWASCSIVHSPQSLKAYPKRVSNLYPRQGFSQKRGASSRPIPIQINQNIISLGEKSDWDGILNEYAVNRPFFNDINYATAMNRLSKLNPKQDDTRLQQLLLDVAQDLSDLAGVQRMGIQGVSNILHSLTKLGQYDTLRTIQASLEDDSTATYIIEKGSPQSIATIVWSYAKGRIEAPNLCALISRDADRLGDKASSRDVANIVWALAKLGVTDTTWFSTTLEKQVSKIIIAKNLQDVVNCLWACAAAGSGPQCPRLFAFAEQQAPRFVWNPRDMSNAVWAFATLGIASNRLFQVMDKNAKTIVRDGYTQSVSNCAWACGTMDVQAPLLFQEINANAARLSSAANATEIASIVTAAVRLDQQLPDFLAALETNAERIVNDKVGNPQALSNIHWAAAKQGVKMTKLIDQTIKEDQVDRILKHGSAQEVTIIAWAMVEVDTIKFKRSVFYEKLVGHSQHIRSSGDVRAVSTLDYVLSKAER